MSIYDQDVTTYVLGAGTGVTAEVREIHAPRGSIWQISVWRAEWQLDQNEYHTWTATEQALRDLNLEYGDSYTMPREAVTASITYIEVIGSDWKDNPTTNLIGREPYIIAESREWYGHRAVLVERRSDHRRFCVYPRGMARDALKSFVADALEREAVSA